MKRPEAEIAFWRALERSLDDHAKDYGNGDETIRSLVTPDQSDDPHRVAQMKSWDLSRWLRSGRFSTPELLVLGWLVWDLLEAIDRDFEALKRVGETLPDGFLPDDGHIYGRLWVCPQSERKGENAKPLKTTVASAQRPRKNIA